jgi:murein DD-endopeptidase MepM/ murein hydrolase activator NlpD
MPGPVRDAADAYQQMEAMLLRQMLSASGAFKASEIAGGHLRADMFIETLADAVAKSGGIGIARMLEDSMPAEDAGQEMTTTPKSARGLRGSSMPGAPKLPALDVPGEITSGFGRRSDPIDGASKYHTGVDLRAPEGSAIRVAAGGIVKNAGPRGGYGNAVEIDHGNGLSTLYAHASELLVTKGQKVTEGQQVGRAGMTGRATGPHLHFEVRVNDHPVDPTRALNSYRERAEDTNAGKPPGRGAR